MNNITVIAPENMALTRREFKKIGKKHNLKVDFQDIKTLNNLKGTNEKLGEVIIYRISSLDVPVGRTTFLSCIGKRKKVINEAIYLSPMVAQKAYQQKIIETTPSLKGIETFHFQNKKDVLKAVEKGSLKYPFIMKANLSARGDEVFLLKEKKDLDLIGNKPFKYIFQNFIKNSGDYRVFVVGGKTLGIIKRVAKPGEYRNNISKGGSAYEIKKNNDEYNQLSGIALKAASLFGLQVCGIDIIFDEKENEYKILEINTVPRWTGFQQATGINVPEQILCLADSYYQRRHKTACQLILDYYEKNYDYLDGKKIHYTSRMYLWNRRKIDRQRLDELKGEYLGKNIDEIRLTLKDILKTDPNKDRLFGRIAQDLRQSYFEKYPAIINFDRILFRTLFAQTLYGLDLRRYVKELVADEELLELKDSILNDEKCIETLSTYAINFLYLLENYFGQSLFDPDLFLKIAQRMKTGKEELLRLKIYLLTHCVVGESRFYSERITRSKNTYLKMIEELERIISENYFNISLDNKFEFLVACRLTGCLPSKCLEKQIYSEAERSFSRLGNYLVDTLNDKKNIVGDNIVISEHRNVLYLMSCFPKKSS